MNLSFLKLRTSEASGDIYFSRRVEPSRTSNRRADCARAANTDSGDGRRATTFRTALKFPTDEPIARRLNRQLSLLQKYIKVAFFRGASLRPVPPGESKQKEVRYLDVREDDQIDEKQFDAWVKQASKLPGERM